MHPLIHNVAKPLLVAVAAILVGHCGITGCSSVQKAPPAVTEGAYLTELLNCVKEAQTKHDADLCRSVVDSKFGVDSGVTPEAGSPVDAGGQ